MRDKYGLFRLWLSDRWEACIAGAILKLMDSNPAMRVLYVHRFQDRDHQPIAYVVIPVADYHKLRAGEWVAGATDEYAHMHIEAHA